MDLLTQEILPEENFVTTEPYYESVGDEIEILERRHILINCLSNFLKFSAN
jgi:hypothetical protein